mmetsp:Transcript_46585/g.69326  ORF Transcript_46585/g.69326 Transcript_46585/m.69326 type:complete len:232 (+) Transcript_46585:218-913(+)
MLFDVSCIVLHRCFQILVRDFLPKQILNGGSQGTNIFPTNHGCPINDTFRGNLPVRFQNDFHVFCHVFFYCLFLVSFKHFIDNRLDCQGINHTTTSSFFCISQSQGNFQFSLQSSMLSCGNFSHQGVILCVRVLFDIQVRLDLLTCIRQQRLDGSIRFLSKQRLEFWIALLRVGGYFSARFLNRRSATRLIQRCLDSGSTNVDSFFQQRNAMRLPILVNKVGNDAFEGFNI